MTKRILTIIFALVIAAIPALASIVTVNFSGLPSTDLTTTPVTQNGVTFSYNTFGQDLADVVTIDSLGVHGSNVGYLSGELDLAFASPAVGLTFDYTVTNSDGALVNDVVVILQGSGSLSDQTGVFAYGSLATPPTGVGSFSSGSAVFSFDFSNGHSFTLSSLQYDTGSGVPEPGTVALLACGLLGLCGRKLLRGRS